MTIASMPFWILLAGIGGMTVALPSSDQLCNTFLVAIGSGIFGTALFFKATDMVRKDQKALASVEATQAAEVIFALVGEVFLLGMALPDGLSLLGVGIVILGMLLHCRNV